jgi:hypothetical protein
MSETQLQDTTTLPDYLITLSEIYQYILGPDWGRTQQIEESAEKAEGQDARHHRVEAN